MTSRADLAQPLGANETAGELSNLLQLLAEAAGASAETRHRLPDLMSEPSPHARLKRYFDAVDRLSEFAQDETCNASVRRLAPGTSAFLMSSLVRASTLAGALDGLAEGYNLFHRGPFNRVERRGGRTVYIVDDEDFPYASPAFQRYRHAFIESCLVYVHSVLEELSEPAPVEALRIETRRPAGQASELLAFWTVPVTHGAAHYAVHFDSRRLAEAPSRGAETVAAARATLQSLVSRRLSARALSAPGDSLVEALKDALAAGALEQPAAARRVGMSVATLRRRLAERGLTFRDLRAEALNAQACDLLARGRSTSEVAARLGFSDLRSFSRAFKLWNGATPAAFRRARETSPTA